MIDSYHCATVDPSACISPEAIIVGDVSVGANCTVFWGASLRGDEGAIVIGEGSNVQEGCIVHSSTTVGRSVTVGHGVILHGCIIGDETIVGMGSIVLDGAVVGKGCLIGAGALVTGTARIPDGMLVLGSPARAVRPLTEEEAARTRASAADYVETGRRLANEGRMVSPFSGNPFAECSYAPGFTGRLGVEFISATPRRIEARMPISERILQPFGFVHGGATIALLESVASRGAELLADLEKERPFGIEANILHRKSGKQGWVRGVAELDHCERNKQFWNVAAYDDEGDVMSDGTFVTKIVSLERLAEIERQRAEAKKSAQDA